MVGAFAVGKTSLVQQHVRSFFSEKYHTTVGVKIDKKTMVVSGRHVDLIIWDLYGEDEFQTVQMSYLRGSSGALYVVDGTRRKTLEVAMKLKARADEAVGPLPAVFALNKCDLEHRWELTEEDARRLTDDRIPAVRTSAKTGLSVEAAFQALVERMLEAP
jgi:small GTP-binding protein